MQDAVLLSGVTLPTGQTADVLVQGETISAVAAPGSLDRQAAQRLDLQSYHVLPAPAEPHDHLDKALTAGRLANPAGDLDGAVQAWCAYRPTREHDDVVRRAPTAALTQLANGVTAIRSHVDVGPDIGLRSLEAVAEVREALRGQVELQLVALPMLPLTGEAGRPNAALLRAAMEAGADVVGGCPYRDDDPTASQELCLELAAELGRPLDLHSDECLDPAVLNLPQLAELVSSSRFPHGVAASHCCSLGVQPAEVAKRVAAELAAAGVGVISCPQTNLFLQARGHASAPPRGLTALRALLDAGVLVAAGGDNLQDPFNTVGRGDPLEIASLLVAAGHLSPEEAYRAVSASSRAVMGLPEVRVEAGFPAELLAIRAASVQEAVATASPKRVVVHQGRVVARSSSDAASGPASRMLAFEGVSKRFADGTVALEGVDLQVAPGEFVTVVGPSGCGKSTLLRIASGLETASGGVLRGELDGLPRAERSRLAREALELVGLTEFAKHLPHALSGGMRMRASLARSLTLRPELLLLFLARRFAALFITHSVGEAVFLSTRVVVLSGRPGRVLGSFEVPFEYPRAPELRYAEPFSRVAGAVSACLREGSA